MDKAAAIIRARAPSIAPEMAIVLGSGLGGFTDQVEGATIIPYGELPGFPATSVPGHAGRLLLGRVAGVPVAVMQGRAHYYEDGKADAMKGAIESLARIGCGTLLLTNAAGSLRPDVGPGSLMLVTDHINFTGISPLVGERDSNRFVDMTEAYDRCLCEDLRQAALAAGIVLSEGVYAWFAGPNFETPAEIRAARVLGADGVGMSLVPEVILARHAGLRVAGLSIITNLAAGMDATLSHTQTLVNADLAATALCRLLSGFLAALREREAVG
ncbi:MAG: purine-nucleoside phosphorylase [Rhodospirillaceae bacterium]|nr:purine-nucleoside phosphorylase [Rhodospirillaceae bacterium]